ncbi:MAG: VirB4 family type IV secretion system protein [Candidatus Amoebophilus sp.]
MKLEPGELYDVRKTDPKKKGYIGDCISIYSFENGYILNKDNSIAVGFEVTLFEEETKDGDGFTSILNEFSAACKRLPTGTVIQKLDIYYEEEFNIPVAHELPFFHRKTLEHFNHKNVLKHRTFIFLRFFSKDATPLNTFLTLGNLFFKPSLDKLPHRFETVKSSSQEFINAMPAGLTLKRLTDEENKTILYQYGNLNFNREPLGFETGITALDDSIFTNAYVKSVRMERQANDVFDWSKNNFGTQGVTSPFMWPLTHFAPFPHIICQQIEIIDDQKFRKDKSEELSWVAQFGLSARSIELAEYIQDSFMELEKELQETDTKIVKFNYNILVWDTDKETLQLHVDHIKSAFGKIGIESEEEKEDTLATFFANMPGCTGFMEGCYMPLDTAVAHLNFITPKKGDEKGILLANRHGEPIYYDTFKYSLDNQHAFIFGPTGSGKSFFNGKMIKDRYYAGQHLMVIDSGGTYRLLFEALGGTYIEYLPDKPLKFNPFLVQKQKGKYAPSSLKISFLIYFLGNIWKENLKVHPITAAEYSLLSEFLTVYYESLAVETVPSLTDFAEWLPSYVEKIAIETRLFDLKNFLISIKPFTHGMYKEHFNAVDAFHIEDTRLICFELQAVRSDPKLYPIVMKVLFEYLTEIIDKNPEPIKSIEIEEGWEMLNDFSKDYVEALLRKVRKANTAVRPITQSTGELKKLDIAEGIQTNFSTYILLYNDKESVRKEIADFLGMDAFDMEKYASLQRRDSYIDGYREVFIKEMDKSYVLRVGLSIYEHAVLTSQPQERNAILKLKREKNSLEEAVIEWTEATLKKYKKDAN